MAKIEGVIKSEIQRLAKREIRLLDYKLFWRNFSH